MSTFTEDLKLTIRSLCPELCEDWLRFFDGIAFKDHGEWAFCYCLEGAFGFLNAG